MGEALRGRRDALKDLRDRGGVKALGQVLSGYAFLAQALVSSLTCAMPDTSNMHRCGL